MHSALHKGLTRLIAREPGVETKGWRRTLQDALADDAQIDIPNRLPDAFRVDQANRRATIWEVEIRHPLTDERLFEWARLWFVLDCHSWDFDLVVVNRLGEFRPVNLPALWWASLDAGRSAA
jgi:hypothetical protein